MFKSINVINCYFLSLFLQVAMKVNACSCSKTKSKEKNIENYCVWIRVYLFYFSFCQKLSYYDISCHQPLPVEENTKLEFSNETTGTNVPRQHVPAIKDVSAALGVIMMISCFFVLYLHT